MRFHLRCKITICMLLVVLILGKTTGVDAAQAVIYATGADGYSNLSWGADAIGSRDLCKKLIQKYGDVSKMPEITVGVIDSGIDYKNTFFSGRIKSKSYDLVDYDGDAMDENGHGTHVAGIIADITLPNVKLYAYRVADKKGEASIDAIVEAIDQAIFDQVDIINISLGAEIPKESVEEKSLKEALARADKKDILVVAAAGNGNLNKKGIDVGNIWPACDPDVVTVSAIQEDHQIASFSNYGRVIDLCAPGVDINSTYLGSKFVEMSGTSMACPFISGAAALLLTDDPTMTHAQVIEGLRSIATDLGEPGFDEYYGYGLINLDNWTLHEKTPESDEAARTQKPKSTRIVKLANTSQGIKISWKKSSNAQGYYVYRKTASGKYKKIKTITGKARTTYTDTKAVHGKTYRYKVVPYHKNIIGTCTKTMKIKKQ